MHRIQHGSDTIEYSIRFSSRARRRRIVVRAGSVTAVAPKGDSVRALHRMVRGEARWILTRQRVLRQKADRMKERTSYAAVDGSRLYVWGRRARLRLKKETGGPEEAGLKDDVLTVAVRKGEDAGDIPGLIQEELAKLVMSAAEGYAEYYSGLLGVRPGKIRVREMKTRWGSCGVTGNISLNLRLAHFPRHVLQYVVAHEICHLVHRNHAERFRLLLNSVLPEELKGFRRTEQLLWPGNSARL